MLTLRTPLFVCPSDTGPKANFERPMSMHMEFAGQDPGIESRLVVTAKSNYVGVNSIHPATSFVHVRRESSAFPVNNYGVFGGLNQNRRIRELTDGLSNTVVLGERSWEYRAQGQKYYPHAATTVMSGNALEEAGTFGMGDSDTCATINNGRCINFPHDDPIQAKNTFSSRHPGGANFGFSDGSIRFISQSANPDVMTQMGHISDGEVVGTLD